MINTLTLNPAIDKILYLDKIERNITNRITDLAMTIGGKGTHVSINLSQMGLENRAFGFAYGEAGRYIINTLQSAGIDVHFLYDNDCESRTNTILIESDNSCTTIAERGPQLKEKEFGGLITLMGRIVQSGDIIVLSGDASNCSDPFIYNRIADEFTGRSLKIVLDASGEYLRRGLECSPFMIKPNQDELENLCGFSIENDEDVIRGIDSLDHFGIEVIAVSLGGRGSIVRFGNEYYKASPPKVEVRNTVGCGDSFLAAILFGFEKGMSHTDMLKLATAVSAATAASSLSVGFDSGLADSLITVCKVERIK